MNVLLSQGLYVAAMHRPCDSSTFGAWQATIDAGQR
jgi:hypothetical protein